MFVSDIFGNVWIWIGFIFFIDNVFGLYLKGLVIGLIIFLFIIVFEIWMVFFVK